MSSEMITGFEGAEKILHIKIVSAKPNSGLLSIPQEVWSDILVAAKCTILSKIYTDKITSFILSESSLFVTDDMCIFKTCGKTVLLFALPLVLNMLKEKGLELEYFLYSSKDFLFPTEQIFPHGDWKAAENYLQSFFPEERSIVLGNSTQDNVFLFTVVATPYQGYATRTMVTETCAKNNLPTPESPVSCNFAACCEGGLESCYLNVMMYDMHESIATQFYSKEGVSARDVTEQSGIASIFPDAMIDDYLFEPCGYSMNGLVNDGFFTIHITPEAHCSYASFETNIIVEDYNKLMQAVLTIFRPKRFCVTFFNHSDLQRITENHPLKETSVVIPQTEELYSRIEYSEVEKSNSFYRIANYINVV